MTWIAAAWRRWDEWRARPRRSGASAEEFNAKYGVERWLEELRATPEEGPRHAKPKGAS